MDLRTVTPAAARLLALAGEADYPALVARVGRALVPVLRDGAGLPSGLAEEVRRTADPVLVEAVKQNPALAWPDADATRELIEKLHGIKSKYPSVQASAPRSEVAAATGWAWDVVLAAHADRPIAPKSLEALVGLKGCPDDVATQLVLTHPRGLDVLVAGNRPISPAVLRALIRTPVSAETLTVLAKTRLGQDFSGADLLTEVRPARVVLKVAYECSTRSSASERERAEWAAFRTQLADLVTDRLGENVPAWRRLSRRLLKFDLSVTELIDDAVAKADRSGTDGDWPDAAELPPNLDPPGTAKRIAFVALLNAAPLAAQWTLLRHLDGRTRYDLLAHGEWRDEWFNRALADDDSQLKVLLARHQHLSVESIEALAALDDPAVNVGLIYQRHATPAQRHKLVNGIPFRPGRAERLSLDPAFRTMIQGYWVGHKPLVHSDDPELVRRCLTQLSLPQNRMLRVILEWWERDGHPGRILERLPDSTQKTVRTVVTKLAAAPDLDAALRRLRAAVHEAEAPHRIARRLRVGTEPKTLIAEGYRWDWDVLVADHRDKPFEASVLGKLRELDGCPALLRDGVPAELSTAEQRAHKALVNGEPPATVLTRTAIPYRHSGWAHWVEHVIRCGDLAPVDVLRYGHPAPAVLSLEPVDDAYRTELAALVGKHLDGRPDAWLLALTMLPDFAGPVPELLAAAALAAG